VQVANELSFTRAAAKLLVAQPSLSQQIKSLERELKVPLFRRTKRKVELTAEGEFFLLEARELVHKAEQAMDDVRRMARGQLGRLRIGYTQSSIYDVLPLLLRRFRDSHPEIEIKLERPALTPVQVDALEKRLIDVALLRPPIRSDQLSLLTVRQEVFMAALSGRHPFASRGSLDLVDLAEEDFITLPLRDGSVLLAETISLCQRAGFVPRVRQEAAELDTILRLVAADLGIAIVPSATASLWLPDVVFKPLAGKSPRLETCLAWRSVDDSAIVRDFVNVAHELGVVKAS
jgi:DNA-binding transcriptional LysR family regulator